MLDGVGASSPPPSQPERTSSQHLDEGDAVGVVSLAAQQKQRECSPSRPGPAALLPSCRAHGPTSSTQDAAAVAANQAATSRQGRKAFGAYTWAQSILVILAVALRCAAVVDPVSSQYASWILAGAIGQSCDTTYTACGRACNTAAVPGTAGWPLIDATAMSAFPASSEVGASCGTVTYYAAADPELTGSMCFDGSGYGTGSFVPGGRHLCPTTSCPTISSLLPPSPPLTPSPPLPASPQRPSPSPPPKPSAHPLAAVAGAVAAAAARRWPPLLTRPSSGDNRHTSAPARRCATLVLAALLAHTLHSLPRATAAQQLDSSMLLAASNLSAMNVTTSVTDMPAPSGSRRRLAQVSMLPGWTVTTLAGQISGSGDGTGTNAQFSCPEAIAVDTAGNLFVTDRCNHIIRRVTPSGVVTTFAGLAGNPGSADGSGTAARFNVPYQIAADNAGNLYVADSSNHRIRRVTPLGVVTTLAGSGGPGFTDGTGTNAQFTYPSGVAVDSSGTIFVVDTSNNAIHWTAWRAISEPSRVAARRAASAGFSW